jgi:hypothetical protein
VEPKGLTTGSKGRCWIYPLCTLLPGNRPKERIQHLKHG